MEKRESKSAKNPPKDKVSFGVVNDIHGDANLLRNLLGHMCGSDMLVMNGDMDNWFADENVLCERFLNEIRLFGEEGPEIFYARGNHEWRGIFAQKFLSVFRPDGGETYAAFRRGPI